MTTKRCVLAVDVGSSACKLGAFGLDGAVRKTVSVPTAMSALDAAAGVREYRPEIWWDAVCGGIRRLLDEGDIRGDEILAVGLTGQIGTHLVLGRGGEFLLPAISWQDGRSKPYADELDRRYPGKALDELTGVHLPPSAAWPIPRLMWLRATQPDLFESRFTLMQNKDLIAQRLTGNVCTDVLSLRGILHPAKRSVDERIGRDVIGVPDIASFLPKALDAIESAGTVTAGAAAETGLPAGTPVVVGCGDFHASLIGSGLRDGTSAFNITGTSDHVGVLCPRGRADFYDEKLGKYPAVQDGLDIWYGATSAGGGSVDWFLKSCLQAGPEANVKQAVAELLARTSSSEGLIYLPYLNGERAPIWDARARGVFFGLSSAHNASHMMRAVLEGVAFSLNQCLSIIRSKGLVDAPVRVSGAASRDGGWNRIKADVFGVPVVTMKCVESTCLGAAILAAVGGGAFGTLDEAIAAMTSIDATVEPDTARRAYYDELIGIYAELYPALKSQFEKLSAVKGR